MLPTADPADVVRAVAEGVTRLVTHRLTAAERDSTLDALAACYAEDTDVRHPFAPLGAPALRTRTQLRAHFASSVPDTPIAERFDWADPTVHRTEDPEVVIVEFVRLVRAGGREARVPSIYVVRVRGGLIVESRDYTDHVGLARALGRLDDLARALLAEHELPDDRRAVGDLAAQHGSLPEARP